MLKEVSTYSIVEFIRCFRIEALKIELNLDFSFRANGWSEIFGISIMYYKMVRFISSLIGKDDLYLQNVGLMKKVNRIFRALCFALLTWTIRFQSEAHLKSNEYFIFTLFQPGPTINGKKLFFLWWPGNKS